MLVFKAGKSVLRLAWTVVARVLCKGSSVVGSSLPCVSVITGSWVISDSSVSRTSLGVDVSVRIAVVGFVVVVAAPFVVLVVVVFGVLVAVFVVWGDVGAFVVVVLLVVPGVNEVFLMTISVVVLTTASVGEGKPTMPSTTITKPVARTTSAAL